MTVSLLRDRWQPAVAPGCGTCPRNKACCLATALPDKTNECAGKIRRRRSLARDDRLYRRGSAFTSVYLVCSGSLKTQRETPEGDLVVTGFFLPGDIIGIDAVAEHAFPCDAIATSASEVCQLDFTQLLSRCAARPALHEWMMSCIARYVMRKDRDLCWSTSLAANRRVLRFFVDLYERLTPTAECSRVEYCLPMRKQDIARYLHISPETLSRNLSQLRREGLLYLDRDRFRLPDTERAFRATRL